MDDDDCHLLSLLGPSSVKRGRYSCEPCQFDARTKFTFDRHCRSSRHRRHERKDDQKSHGNPLHYLEDAFEKNHGPIRQSFQHQNGHAKSRDTARKMAKFELVNHLVHGGYLKYSGKWECPGNKIMTEVSNVLPFLGQQNETQNNTKGPLFTHIERDAKKKPKEYDALSYIEMVGAVLGTGGNPNHPVESVHTFGKVTTHTGQKASINEFVLYKDDETERIGKIILLIGIRQRKHMRYAVKLQQTSISVPTTSKIILDDEFQWISAASIIDQVHVVHACLEEGCAVAEMERQQVMEQEKIMQTVKYLKHSQNKKFIVNRFRFKSRDE